MKKEIAGDPRVRCKGLILTATIIALAPAHPTHAQSASRRAELLWTTAASSRSAEVPAGNYLGQYLATMWKVAADQPTTVQIEHLRAVDLLMAGEPVSLPPSSIQILRSVLTSAPHLAAAIGSFRSKSGNEAFPGIERHQIDVLNLPPFFPSIWAELFQGAATDQAKREVVNSVISKRYVGVQTDASVEEMLLATKGLTLAELLVIEKAAPDELALKTLLAHRIDSIRSRVQKSIPVVAEHRVATESGTPQQRAAVVEETEQIEKEAEAARQYFSAAEQAARVAGLEPETIQRIGQLVRVGKAFVEMAALIAAYSAGTGNTAGFVVGMAIIAMTVIEEFRAEEASAAEQGFLLAISQQIAELHEEMRLQFGVVNVKLDAILAGVAQALKLLLQNQASLEAVLLDLAILRDEAVEFRANMSRLIEELAAHFDAQNERYCVQYRRRRDPSIPLLPNEFARCLSDYVSRAVASNVALAQVPEPISEDKLAEDLGARDVAENVRYLTKASAVLLKNAAIPRVFETRLPNPKVWAVSVGGYFGFAIQWLDRFRPAISRDDLAELRSFGQDLERFVANHVGATRPERERILGEIWTSYKTRLEETRVSVAASLLEIAKNRARLTEGPLKVEVGLPPCPDAVFTPNRARAGLGAAVALSLPPDLGETLKRKLYAERAGEKIGAIKFCYESLHTREPEGFSPALNNPWGLGMRVRGFVDGVTLFSTEVGPVGLIRDDIHFTLFGMTDFMWSRGFPARVVAGIAAGLSTSDAEEKYASLAGPKLLQVEKARTGILFEWGSLYVTNQNAPIRQMRASARRAQGWRVLLQQSALLSLTDSYSQRRPFRSGLAGTADTRLIGDDVLAIIAACLSAMPGCSDEGRIAGAELIKLGPEIFFSRRLGPFETDLVDLIKTDPLDQKHPLIRQGLYRIGVLEKIVGGGGGWMMGIAGRSFGEDSEITAWVGDRPRTANNLALVFVVGVVAAIAWRFELAQRTMRWARRRSRSS